MHACVRGEIVHVFVWAFECAKVAASVCYTRVHAYTGDVDDGVPPGDGHVGNVARARRRHDREVGAYVIYLYHIYIDVYIFYIYRCIYYLYIFYILCVCM